MFEGERPDPSPCESTPPASSATCSRGPQPVGASLLLAPVTDAVVDGLILRINALSRGSVLELARAIGSLIVDTFYAGDMGAWRSRREKDASFRKLAARADAGEMELNRSGLQRAVALVEMESRLGVTTWGHLSMCHVRLTFALPADHQRELLARAEAEKWTVLRMEREVRAVHREPEGSGRRPRPAFVRGIRHFGRMLDDASWFGELDRAGQLGERERAALVETLAAVRRKCDELEQRLGDTKGLGV